MSVVKLGTNISSIKAQRKLGEATLEVSSVFERLSSGLRINKASDDAAGLSIASMLNSQQRVYSQGIRNLNDGISLLSIADKSIEQLGLIVTRITELAEQSANGSYGYQQRKALDQEAQSLSDEFQRIIQTTKFNGRALFSGSFGELRLQAGYGLEGGIQSALGGTIGTGTFEAARSANSTLFMTSLELFDINRDGILDSISTTNAGGLNFLINIGNGDGTFKAAQSYAVGSTSLSSSALGDINNDGICDVVIGSTAGGGLLHIAIGNSDGTFKAFRTSSLGDGGNQDLKLADINNDGNLDLVSAGTGLYAQLGLGSGSFGQTITISSTATTVLDYSLNDLNGDGFLDITAGHNDVSSQISTFLGNGNGTFNVAGSYSIGSVAAGAIEIADLNGDGKLDLVATLSGVSSYFTALGNGNGSFVAATSRSLAGTGTDIALGDLNGDGSTDIIVGGAAGTASKAYISLNNGDGTFAATTSLLLIQGTIPFTTNTSMRVADLNSDGALDIFTHNVRDFASGHIATALGATTSGISALEEFSLKSQLSALDALTYFKKVADRLARQRGTIGAFQSRIDAGIQTTSAAAENFSAAASRITDTDIAFDSAQLVRAGILQKASAAVLAQANLQPEIAIKLLKDSGAKK